MSRPWFVDSSKIKTIGQLCAAVCGGIRGWSIMVEYDCGCKLGFGRCGATDPTEQMMAWEHCNWQHFIDLKMFQAVHENEFNIVWIGRPGIDDHTVR